MQGFCYVLVLPLGRGAKFEYQKSSRGVPCERGAYFEVYVRFFGSGMVLPLGRGAQKKLAERPVREWCTLCIARTLRGRFAGASVRAWCASWKVHGPRGAPVREWRRPGKFTGPGALPCENGARRATRGRSRVGVVHSGEFTGAPVRAWCASWKVIGGLTEFVPSLARSLGA